MVATNNYIGSLDILLSNFPKAKVKSLLIYNSQKPINKPNKKHKIHTFDMLLGK